MRTTWEKIVHHVGTIYGQDISNELLNKKTVNLPEPAYTQAILDKHIIKVARHATQHVRIMHHGSVRDPKNATPKNSKRRYRCRRYHGTCGSFFGLTLSISTCLILLAGTARSVLTALTPPT
jgi:hypothetical protein